MTATERDEGRGELVFSNICFVSLYFVIFLSSSAFKKQI